MTYITTYCRIRNYAVHNKSECLFQNPERNLQKFLDQAYEELQVAYPKYFKMDSLSKLGIIASEIVLKEARLTYANDQIAVILSNASASLDTDLKYQQSLAAIPSPSLFVYTLPNIVIGEIAIRHGLKGENEFFIFEKFNPVFMENYISQVLEETPASACLAGWIDVLGEHHDVFLYLVEKEKRNDSVEHTILNLDKLYM